MDSSKATSSYLARILPSSQLPDSIPKGVVVSLRKDRTIGQMEDRLIISVHFPKAAGTSLAEGLQAHFGERLLRDYETDPVDPLHPRRIAPHLYPMEPVDLPTSVRAVHGHFHVNKYSLVRHAFRITFLREPIENLLSIYYFWRKYQTDNGHATFQLFKKILPTLFEFAEFPSIKRLMSQTYFGDVPMSVFDFIGFYDRRDRDLARLEDLLGITLPQVHANRMSDDQRESRNSIMNDGKAIEQLRQSLAEDCAFYDRIRQMWD
jgi:hypothetical protein